MKTKALAKRKTVPASANAVPAARPAAMLGELRELILTARQQVAQVVNAGLTLLHWKVGSRIHREILKQSRADYGAEIVATLSRELEAEFGRGFGRRNLFSMVRFAEYFLTLRLCNH